MRDADAPADAAHARPSAFVSARAVDMTRERDDASRSRASRFHATANRQTMARAFAVVARASVARGAPTRRGVATSIVLAPFVTLARPRVAASDDGAYVEDTMRTLDACERFASGAARAGDEALVSGWFARNRSRYSQSTHGRSFLMTQKVISLTRAGTGGEAKTREWIALARGLTDGSISGAEARERYGAAAWGNYDKSDPKNRIGLCVFGATGPTKALGIDCDGY